MLKSVYSPLFMLKFKTAVKRVDFTFIEGYFWLKCVIK